MPVPGIPANIDADGKIYVRSYALGNQNTDKPEKKPEDKPEKKPEDNPEKKPSPSIPGPTFVFQPGDLLRLRFHNYLNRAADPALNAAQNNPQHTGPANAAASSDDTDEHVSHEISIPNDSNVTNLHVHGLHVDPKQDDVTLLVLPEDNDPGALTPELQRFVPTINRWWTRTYQYQLPEDHLPGTYWYHSHKHGSTSSQVENGMAGTLIIRPKKEEDDPVPGLWASGHDRIMMIQELANYSTPSMLQNDRKGKGQGQGSPPVTTVNGLYQPVLDLPPGQVERWRFIVAGANHTTSSYIWVGKITPSIPKDTLNKLSEIDTPDKAKDYLNPPSGTPQKFLPAASTLVCTTMPGSVKLIALDGITMWQSRNITPDAPAFGSAGNRLDLLVQADASAAGKPWRIYQNYPVDQADLADVYPEVFGEGVPAPMVQLRMKVLTSTTLADGKTPTISFQTVTKKALTAAIPTDPFAMGTNYQGLSPMWVSVDADGRPIPGTEASMPVVPLLKGRPTPNKGVEIDPDFAQTFGDGQKGWQSMPDAGGGFGVAANALVTLNVSGQASGPTTFPKDLDDWLTAHSPAGKGSALQRVSPVTRQLEQGIPHYVSPMPDEKIAGAQVAVFDRGQFTFSYVNKATQQLIDVRQFWINGRQFNVDDWIGNPASPSLIQKPLQNVEPSLGEYSPNAAAKTWTHKTPKGLLVTNPGYFQTISQVGTTKDGQGNEVPVYNYDYNASKMPSYEGITGLPSPHTPVSTTAEEWLLVNNSDLFHPFHIHINPFFVTEIGQLNDDGKSWSLKKITLDQKADTKVPFSWVVGNWWDVITIPPHGYVRFRMWINVPTQHPTNKDDPDSDLVVTDNSNTYGSWVFHCHILRHEDRGMMLMVNTTPKSVQLDGSWTQDDGAVRYKITDNHGGLTLTTLDKTNPFFERGTFTRGVGNPLFSQPFLGSMTDSANGITAFCLEGGGNRLLSSNGHFYLRNGASYKPGPTATKLDLSGTWVDNEKRTVKIAQGAPDKNGVVDLTFTPTHRFWWTTGSGTWAQKPPLAYTGTLVVEDNGTKEPEGDKDKDPQNQMLTFCISADLNTLVFSNGITWTRTKP